MKSSVGMISDKLFLRSFLLSVGSILLCLALLCSMTYAWFSDGIESDRNALVSGSFLLEFKVKDSDGNEIPLTGNAFRPSARTALLPRTGVYTVTLTLTEQSDAKGYCIVTCDNMYPKLTEVIVGESTKSKDGRELNSPFIFQVEVTVAPGAGGVPLVLEPRCGVPSAPHILYNTKILQSDFEVQH